MRGKHDAGCGPAQHLSRLAIRHAEHVRSTLFQRSPLRDILRHSSKIMTSHVAAYVRGRAVISAPTERVDPRVAVTSLALSNRTGTCPLSLRDGATSPKTGGEDDL